MSAGNYDVVIVGGGHAGAQTAISLRKLGYEGSIAIIDKEPDLPYERPALTKDYLAGAKPFERILIRPESFWRERNVHFVNGRRVTKVDPEAHGTELDDGRRVGYGKLVWTAGGTPRALNCGGCDLQGIHYVRCRGDADRLRRELEGASRVIVIGGGYVGLEAAAVLTKLGHQVTLLESQDRVLARVAGPTLSGFYERQHRKRGVDIRLGVTVVEIEGKGGRANGVRISTGEVLPADLVVVGIGILPNIEPLLSAGAEGGNGVTVSAQCLTSLPDIFAAGDCALHANTHAENRWIRLESVQNATDMATTVAKAIHGVPEPYNAIPWFWSDQFDLKLQTVGLSAGHDKEVVRGNPEGHSLTVVYLSKGRVVALDCVNAPRDFIQGRDLVARHSNVDPARLADDAVPLKNIVNCM